MLIPNTIVTIILTVQCTKTLKTVTGFAIISWLWVLFDIT